VSATLPHIGKRLVGIGSQAAFPCLASGLASWLVTSPVTGHALPCVAFGVSAVPSIDLHEPATSPPDGLKWIFQTTLAEAARTHTGYLKTPPAAYPVSSLVSSLASGSLGTRYSAVCRAPLWEGACRARAYPGTFLWAGERHVLGVACDGLMFRSCWLTGTIRAGPSGGLVWHRQRSRNHVQRDGPLYHSPVEMGSLIVGLARNATGPPMTMLVAMPERDRPRRCRSSGATASHAPPRRNRLVYPKRYSYRKRYPYHHRSSRSPARPAHELGALKAS
jgi:hypothetical protein